MAKSKGGGGVKPDIASLAGLLLAVGAIMAGLLLEGGKVQDVSQITAAMIVLGGTIGAVMLTSPMSTVLGAAKRLTAVFMERTEPYEKVLDEIVDFATQARKEGIVSLEKRASDLEDPFLRKALSLAVDGIDLSQLRGIMELEIEHFEAHGEAEAKVFEAAGGYAPTVGIIGAVLGLIQVMKNLANIDEVGRGIAVAFVATVYGVAVANLFFLPAAGKLKARVQQGVRMRELMLHGVLAIVEGSNPKLIRTKLEAYLPASRAKEPKGAAKATGVAAAVST
jgi:chemotaxis protein MotA